MFYVADIAALRDEMTRTQYFLQLKNDVLEGSLHCSYDKAVLLASYSLQAELGDYEPNRHSAQYIREFSIFPKHMLPDEERRESFTEEALQAHSSLRGLTQALAEVYFIMEAQQLEGYGQEHFVCRDDCGADVMVGASLTGIVVRTGGSQPATFYRWADITNLHNHKRNFGIELTENRTVQFVMDDKELAKYVWKVCVQQHKFFDKADQALLKGKQTISQLPPPDIQASTVPRPAEQREPAPGRISPAEQGSSAVFTQEPAFQPEQTYIEAGSDLSRYGVISYSQPHTDSSWNLSQQQQQQQQQQHQNLEQQQQTSQTSRALLPQYRPAPDYDTALKQMYSGGTVPAEPPPAAYMYRSQPEIHHLDADVPDFSPYKNYGDLSHLPPFGCHGNGAAATAVPASGDLISASVHTYSTPELATQSLEPAAAEPGLSSSELQQPFQLYKPPPPYPHSRLASSSTPDLASAGGQVSRSSPDLVSRKNRLNQSPLTSGLSRQTHRTYENLADTGAFSQALSCEELDQVYPVGGPASVSAQFVTQSALVPEIARSHYLGGTVRVSAVDQQPIYENVDFIQRGRSVEQGRPGGAAAGAGAAAAEERSRWARDETPPPPPPAPPQTIPFPAAAMQDLKVPAAVTPPPPDSGSLEKRRRRRWGGGDASPSPSPGPGSGQSTPGLQHHGHEHKSNTLRKIKETFSRTRDPPRIRTSTGSGSGSGSGSLSGVSQITPDVVVKRESTAIPREQRLQAIEARICGPGFFREFESVVKKRETAEYVTARRPENENKNRFKDVLPYEDNRVRITPSKDNPSGYINASHISVTMGSQQRFYIAAQGPLPTTLLHFWQAVWENNVHLIVMLTDATRGHDRAFPYWPQQDSTSVECGEYSVARKMSTRSSAYVTSRLVLTQRGSRRARVVWHLQFTDWADHGCPEDAAGFVQFVNELDTLRQTAASEMAVLPGAGSRNTPVLVHCSAGVGRTGVTIMCDVLLHCLDHNLEVDVPKLLRHLRQQRMLMVQTMTQYKFVYQVLVHYLQRSRLI